MYVLNLVAAKVAERKVHVILHIEVTVELVASKKSLASTISTTSQSNILISNIPADTSDELLLLYLDKLTQLSGESEDYIIKWNGPSQVVVSFNTTAVLPSGGMYVHCVYTILCVYEL